MEHVDLTPDQVIGRTLIEIRQVCESNVNGMDWATIYFVLDSKLSFTLPGEWGAGLCLDFVPDEAVPLSGADVIHGTRILALLRPKEGATIPNESLCLLFENGYIACDIMGDYHGTGSPGLYLFPPGEVDLGQLEPVWGDISN
ncbi:hypothetical protein ETAA8_65100 [Anatilimnocola aggregata]|uniref:Uncharacterized protein n=1 Tax=Anatilimnocola aggregata TaxID=2528021 RepID=A0A517YMA9_9BACT|nr:hypothetical protein [Anatilimnocola aggregata]QDU31354.1 hypothetical protein ETAA8_65100 [Anatilimnocola aggregata]